MWRRTHMLLSRQRRGFPLHPCNGILAILGLYHARCPGEMDPDTPAHPSTLRAQEVPSAMQRSMRCLDGCPDDCFQSIMLYLAPADIAACRLNSRSWRRHVDTLLQALAPSASAQPAAVAAAFPHLLHLKLSAGPATGIDSSVSSSVCGDDSSDSSHTACGGLPPLRALLHLPRLRALHLRGQPIAGSMLDCRSLLPLAEAPLVDLEASCLELRHAQALQGLAQLTRLYLEGYSLDWNGTLSALLLPLRRLAHLHFSAFRAPVTAAAAAATREEGADAAAADRSGEAAAAAGQLAGLRQLTSLVSLELCSRDACSDAACGEYAALPRLLSLTVRRCASFGQGAPHITGAGLRLLCNQLHGQLTSLSLSGHAGIGDNGVRCIGRLSLLQSLELRLGAW